MTSVMSRPEPVNLSKRVQGVLCLILSASSWRLAPLNQPKVKLIVISTAIYSVHPVANNDDPDKKIAEFVFECNLPS